MQRAKNNSNINIVRTSSDMLGQNHFSSDMCVVENVQNFQFTRENFNCQRYYSIHMYMHVQWILCIQTHFSPGSSRGVRHIQVVIVK